MVEPAAVAWRQEVLGRSACLAGFHAYVVSWAQHEIYAELATTPYCPGVGEASVGHKDKVAEEGFQMRHKLVGEGVL